MPDYQFTFAVQNITPQRATAIRDKLAQRLNDDQIQTINLGFVRNTSTYRIVGVDTADKAVFDQSVEAVDESAAVQQVVGSQHHQGRRHHQAAMSAVRQKMGGG